MGMKAPAHSDARGALCSISCQSLGGRILLADADDKQKVSAICLYAIG